MNGSLPGGLNLNLNPTLNLNRSVFAPLRLCVEILSGVLKTEQN